MEKTLWRLYQYHKSGQLCWFTLSALDIKEKPLKVPILSFELFEAVALLLKDKVQEGYEITETVVVSLIQSWKATEKSSRVRNYLNSIN